MFTKFLTPYKNLSKEIWILTLMTLINRAGAMVIPFLSLYLTKSMGFSLSPQVTVIMVFYGLGSLVGSWVGGKLTDKIGYHKVMYVSLFISGFLFVGIQFLETFMQFAIGIFILTAITDLFRPAIYVAMSSYSNEDNRTRSIALVRIAINLGYAVGPAMAGLLIAKLSYSWLFWIDGLTAILASFIIYKFLFQKDIKKKETKEIKRDIVRPYKDVQFIIFWLVIFLCGVSFVQFIEVWPLFYDKIIHLNEQEIGMILALNGFLIFILEMPIVSYVDKKFKHINLILFGLLLFALSFFVLTINQSLTMVIISMVLISIGEIFCFPFSNTYALDLAKKGNEGEYMGFYTMTFAAAFLVAPLGLMIVQNYGFEILWYAATVILIIGLLLTYIMKRKFK